jgi:NAD(P)H-flavin reductase
VDPELAGGYRSPGQFTCVRADEETGFFVLASAVGQPWELLVRAGGATADMLLGCPLGAQVQMSGALGKGFPYETARDRRLIVAVAGTGIAAARALMRRRIADGTAARTELYVGFRTRAEVPMLAELAVWTNHGARVVACLSRESPLDAEGPVEMAHGYVQDVVQAGKARRTINPPDGAGAMIFAVGPAGLVETMRKLAVSLGIPEADVRTNY